MAGDLSSMESLSRYVIEKTGNVLNGSNIELSVETHDNADFRTLSQSESLNLLRIFQEATNNIVKHADARKVTFSANPVDGGFRLAISDDGEGFSGSPGSGYGLSNIRQRSLDIGADCHIESTSGKGTRIEVTIPD